jgi:hypothetical protein
MANAPMVQSLHIYYSKHGDQMHHWCKWAVTFACQLTVRRLFLIDALGLANAANGAAKSLAGLTPLPESFPNPSGKRP